MDKNDALEIAKQYLEYKIMDIMFTGEYNVEKCKPYIKTLFEAIDTLEELKDKSEH
jgi:hypothetical protein